MPLFLMVLLAQSPDGVLATTSLGQGDGDRIQSIVADAAGALYVGGSSAKAPYVHKLGPKRQTVSRTTGKGTALVTGLALGASGEVWASGSHTFGLELGALKIAGEKRSDAFLLKLNAAGKPGMLTRFGTDMFEGAQAIATDAAGNVFLTGRYQSNVSFGGPALDNGGVYDVFIAGFDKAGRHLFSKGASARGGTETTGLAIAVTSNALYVAGRLQGSGDFGCGLRKAGGNDAAFVARFTHDGTCTWTRLILGDGNAVATALVADDESVYVAGRFSSTVVLALGKPLRSRGAEDLFVARLNAKDGEPTWARPFGDRGWDGATGLALSPGRVWLAGYFQDSVLIDDTRVQGAGKDGLVLALDREAGKVQASWRFGADGDDSVSAITATADRIAVAGIFTGGPKVAELAQDATNKAAGAPAGADPCDPTVAKIAAERGDLENLKRCVPEPVSPNENGDSGWPLVVTAAYKGQTEALKYLLEKGGNPNAALTSGYTALMQAARFGHAEAMQALLEAGARVNERHEREGTALHVVLSEVKGGLELVRSLLARDASVEAVDGQGRTPLMIAAHKGDLAVVRALLAAKSRVDTKNAANLAPLDFAAMQSHTEVAAVLLEAGAPIEHMNVMGMTALFHASHAGAAPIVKLLLAKGAKADITEVRYGDTALMRAANNRHVAVVRMLLDAGVPIDATNEAKMTALHHAARNGAEDVVRLLLERGADRTSTEKDGRTPAALAAKNGHKATAALLEKP